MAPKPKMRGYSPQADDPVYPIGVAARLLDVHPRTLRLYEAEGLIRPKYRGTRRLFSQNDIQWINCLRSMIHDEGISIPGLKRLLALVPCWEISDCPKEIYENCKARVDRSPPKCRCCEGVIEHGKMPDESRMNS